MIELNDIKRIYESRNIKSMFRKHINNISNVSELIDSKYSNNNRGRTETDPLGQILFPLPVNPSNSDRSHIIRHTFTFAGEQDLSVGQELERRRISINYSIDNTTNFVNDLIFKVYNLDRSLNDTTSLSSQSTPSFSVIEGKKGVGKTHLQNFILTNFNDVFDENNVLWVRLNLVRSFGPLGDITISRWAKSQIAKVLLRYYDPKSEYFDKKIGDNRPSADWLSVLFSYISHQYIHDFNVLAQKNEQIVIMLNKFQKRENDQDIHPNWLPEDLVDEIFNYARSKLGFKIILVLDGLDLLTETRLARRKYQERVRAVQEFLTSDSNRRMYTLLFLRPKTIESMHFLRELNQANTTIHSPPEANSFLVESCNIKTLFKKRIDYLLRVDSTVRVETEKIEKFIGFLDNQPSDVLKTNGQPFSWMELITELAKDNARTATQVLSCIPNEFLNGDPVDHTRGDARYKFIEGAMLGRGSFPVKAYSYELVDDEWFRDLDDQGSIYDTLFLPSIFSFPYGKTEKSSKVFKELDFSGYIACFRILQLINLYTFSNGSRVNLNTLSTVLNIIFGYEKKWLKLIFEEISEAEIIDIETNTHGMEPWDIFSYSGKLAVKGERVLKSFCDDVSYLGMCFSTVPLPEGLVNGSGRKRGWFPIASPRRDSLEDWIAAKVVNGLAMLRLVALANEQQVSTILESRSHLLAKLNDTSFDRSWMSLISTVLDTSSAIYNRVPQMTDSVLISALRAINGFGASGGKTEDVMRRIAKFGLNR